MTSRRRFLVAAIALVGVTSAGYAMAADATGPPKFGYVLVTIKSDLSGVLPIKPDSFWRSPQFLVLAPERHYLFGLWPGTYSFGGLTVAHGGWKLGNGTFSKAPFKIEPGKVVYIGQHEFLSTSANTFSWNVSDQLAESLAGLTAKQKESIEGWPIDKQIPVIAPPAQ